MQYERGCSKSNYGTVLDKQPFPVAQYPVHHECTCYALVVAYGICQFAIVTAFHVYYAVTAVHAGVACLNRVGDYRSLVVSAEHVVAFGKRNHLLVAECVLNYNDMPEIFGLYILVILSNAYRKAFAAMLAFEYKRLTLFVRGCVKVYGMVAFGADNLAH